jgi:hypothetical protein
MKEMDFFMQEFRMWSRQLDKLFMIGVAAGYAVRRLQGGK